MWKSIVAVSCGASVGALLRWQLGERLGNLMNALPLGTLAANLLGGYIVGLAIGYFMSATQIAPEWRLLIITGFCGGLTTFSTFSAEVVSLLQAGRFVWALGVVSVHVLGSVLMTIAGLATWQFLRGFH